MTYRPRPIDTSSIELDSIRAQDLERLASHNHDLWALARLNEGWSYGATRSDDKRTNPDLVPYDELPEGEKNYDRRAVIQTLKALIALGYEIQPRRSV